MSRPENVSSTFPLMGDSMADSTVNASADDAAPLSVPRYRLASGRFSVRPLEHRAPLQVDATTGLALDDAVQRTLAHYGDPRATVPAYHSAAASRAERQAAMARAALLHDHSTRGASDILRRLMMPLSDQEHVGATMAVPAKNLAPVPHFPERQRQVYETTIAQNFSRGRSSGRLVDPVLAADPADPSFDDETDFDEDA